MFIRGMIDVGFKQTQLDHTWFIKHSKTWGITALLIYFDDIIIIRNDENEQLMLKQCITKEFRIKELEKLKYFLKM